MDNLMVFDDNVKRNAGVICSIPAASFILTFIYYLTLVWPLTDGHAVAGAVVGITAQNYDTLFVMLAISSILAAGVLIYCLVLLARLKNMNAASKLIWIILLSTFAPVAAVFFWYFLINREPKYVPMHHSMA
jgi:hypothetical protein